MHFQFYSKLLNVVWFLDMYKMKKTFTGNRELHSCKSQIFSVVCSVSLDTRRYSYYYLPSMEMKSWIVYFASIVFEWLDPIILNISRKYLSMLSKELGKEIMCSYSIYTSKVAVGLLFWIRLINILFYSK